MANEIKPFKFWVQNVLPLVYDDSLSYYEVLAKCVQYINNLINGYNELSDRIDNLDIDELEAELQEIRNLIDTIPTEQLQSIVSDIEALKLQMATAQQEIENIPTASDDIPYMNDTGASGTSNTFSRGDHVHPKDSTKANLESPTFTGIPKAPTANTGTNNTQIATTAFVQQENKFPSGGTSGQVLTKQSAADYATAWTSTPPQMGSLAMIETSPATQAHAVGDYIVYKGQLYKVTAAISSQETLTVGTNIDTTTVGAELIPYYVSATVPTPELFRAYNVLACRYGKIVVVSYYFYISNAVAKDTLLATFDLPTNFMTNFYTFSQNGNAVNLKAGTKNLLIEQATTGTFTLYGQLIGMIA